METTAHRPSEADVYKLHRRFDRMGRLIGDEPMQALMQSHVMVIGLGGVGSWAAESLARSGVGKVTLVDFDEVCVTNTNRQLHALSGMVGTKKVEAMATRLKAINPGMQVNPIVKFYNADHCSEIFESRPDFVIDAIDNLTAKCHLLAFCRKQSIPVVCSTGSAGRLDPGQIKVADLSQTETDPLAREVRRILRQKHSFPPEGQAFGIPAVFSVEPHRQPFSLTYDRGRGFQCVCPQGDNEFHTCDDRNVILGSASFVTGAFGLFCASVAVRSLLKE
jgi:tRNA threonylcarbamoyladenosine dehydratase